MSREASTPRQPQLPCMNRQVWRRPFKQECNLAPKVLANTRSQIRSPLRGTSSFPLVENSNFSLPGDLFVFSPETLFFFFSSRKASTFPFWRASAFSFHKPPSLLRSLYFSLLGYSISLRTAESSFHGFFWEGSGQSCGIYGTGYG